MATVTTTSISNTYQRYFSKKLLKTAVQKLVLNQFATQKELPRNKGAKTMAFFRRVAASSANVQTLTEGTPISTFTDVTYAKIDADLVQYGEAIKITDIVSYTELFDALNDGIDLMGEDCALKADDITRNELVINGTQTRFAQGLADFAALQAATTAAGSVIAEDFLGAVTALKIKRARKFGGYYVAILPPQMSHDLQQDADWLDASKYGATEQLFNGELGRLWGCRFVEGTNPFRESTTQGTFDAAGGIYSTIITGQEAYGVPKLSGTPAGQTISDEGVVSNRPQIIINDKPDKSDPLNQFITAGWKAFYCAKNLNTDWFTVLRSKTTFVG